MANFLQLTPENIAQAKSLTYPQAWALESQYKFNPNFPGGVSKARYNIEGLKSLIGLGDPKIGGATPLTRKIALGARNLIGSNVAYGLPFAYAGAASALQKNLEEQGLTGEGGIYDQSGGWGAMGAGADIPILRKMIAERRATKKGTAQAAMQRGIREAEAAKQKAAAQAAAAQQVRQNIQTYGNRDRPNTGINRPGGGRGQSPTGGDVAGTPFTRGGVANLLYGGIV